MKRLLSLLSVVAILLLTAPTASAQEGGFSTNPVSSPDFPFGSFSAPLPSIESVVYASHPGFDRVVFTLSGPVTGYLVLYGNRRDTAGETTVLTEGSAVINVTLNSVLAGNAGTPAPRVDESPGLPQLRQIALLEDFEGTVVYGLAVATMSGFRVVVDGNLLVVDISVPATLAATGGRSVIPIAAVGVALLLSGAVLTRRQPRRSLRVAIRSQEASGQSS